MDVVQKSYAQQAEHHNKSEAEARAFAAQLDVYEKSIDRHNHLRALRAADPLIDTDAEGTWVTLGDGKYGGDAHYIASRGRAVLATDISHVMLQAAKEVGYVPDYRVINAERVDLPDDAFDYALCKEAYHHFPRAPIALYEMLRVARKAVVLVEPPDRDILESLPEYLFAPINRVLRKVLKKPKQLFEPAGNFIYEISRREIEKIALGIGLQVVAFKPISFYYELNLCKEPWIDGSAAVASYKKKLRRSEWAARIGLKKPDLLAAIIFRLPPSVATRARLVEAGYRIHDLPQNPFA